MGKKVIYVAGATDGPPQNLMDLHAAAAEVEARGFIALSPTCLPKGLTDKKRGQILTAMVQSADAVLMLKNWPSSKDATFARTYCTYIDKLYSTNLDVLASVLMER